MGAVCYKPKNLKEGKLSKDDVIRAINDQTIKETIGDTEGVVRTKNFDIQTSQMVNTTQGNNSRVVPIKAGKKKPKDQIFQVGSSKNKEIELNILSYYGSKEKNYNLLAQISKQSVSYLRQRHRDIQNFSKMKHENENFQVTALKAIQEHQSGVNQLEIHGPHLLSISDDCALKLWNTERMIVEEEIQTETITCFTISGLKKDILFASCHSGNLQVISLQAFSKKETIELAHTNLIRAICTLEGLKNEYFVTADVCGGVKVWQSLLKPKELLNFELNGALAYNSIVEIKDRLPKKSDFKHQTLLATALKTEKINIYVLDPKYQAYQLLLSIPTRMKPTCILTLSPKHIACATGNLREHPQIEIFNTSSGARIDTLRHHTDMIDFLKLLQLKSVHKIKEKNFYVQYLLSAGRDKRLVIWKLFDGKSLKRHIQPLFILKNGLPEMQKNIKTEAAWIQRAAKVQKIKNAPPDSEPSASEQEGEPEEAEGKENAFYSLLTNHTDFIRTVVWQPEKGILMTGSEDKSQHIFKLDFAL